MRRAVAFLILLAAPLLALADVTIDGKTTVGQYRLVQLTAKGAPDGAICYWSVGPKLSADQMWKGQNKLTFTAAPGTYSVNLRAVWPVLDKDGKFLRLEGGEVDVDVIIEGPPVPPVPPVPPIPPVPPVPPIPPGAMRVLIVYESADLPKLPAAQQALLFDMKVRGALRDRTDKSGPDGRGFNIWDKDVDVSGAAKFWQDAMKRPRSATPFVHVFKGDAVAYEGPLPADADAMVALLTKYAGPTAEKGK